MARFDIQNGTKAYLIGIASEEMPVLEDKALVCHIDHVVPVIEPGLPKEDDRKKQERCPDGCTDGI